MFDSIDESDRKVIKNFLENRKKVLIASQKLKGLRASGKSAAGLRVDIESDSLGFLIDGTGTFYYQEYGRASGKPPPFIMIYDWLKFKKYGFDYANNKERIKLAWKIINSIRKKGTYTHRTRPTNVVADVVDKDVINDLLERFKKKYSLSVRTEIISQLIKLKE